MSVCCPPARPWTVVCQLSCRRSVAGWRGTCATRTLYGVISRWGARGVGGARGAGGEAGGGRAGSSGRRQDGRGSGLCEQIEPYLNTSKFAILRLLCDALSKSNLSSCHQYLLQLETIFMCLWLAFPSYAIFMLQDIDMNRCLKSFQWRLVAWLEKCHVYLE